MARDEVVEEAVIVRSKYVWPDIPLLAWNLVVIVGAGLILGVFANFMSIQSRMELDTPWIFPYGVTVGAITIIFIVVDTILIIQRRLLPGFMLLFSFMFIALYLTGLIETAIQIFGDGDVASNCNRYVDNRQQHGVSLDTLAWLEQNDICGCWYAAFSFWLILLVFFAGMMIMAAQVSRNAFD